MTSAGLPKTRQRGRVRRLCFVLHEMSSIDKLIISGIRSFDDKEKNAIQFHTPLTLVVGPNGCGKTTIVECLKYATTGDLPPNTKGGAFIHDPKMAHESTVKAQVRLRFKNVSGAEVTCTRGLQLTVGARTTTQKTLEGLLQVVDNMGERRTLSNKCAEMDAQMPRQLGVSKAILDNVIFCHQEESNWPLSEPSILKKKFDAIFEATKYTQALEHIRSLRKERAQGIKIDIVKLEALEKEKKAAEEYRKDLQVKRVKAESKTNVISGLEEELEQLNQESKRVFGMAQDFQAELQKVKALRNEEVFLQSNISDLASNMEELHDDDATLQTKSDHFAEHIERQEQARVTRVQEKRKEEQLVQNLRNKIQNTLIERGKVQAEAKAQEERVESRQHLIRDIVAKHGFSGFEHGDFDDSSVEAFAAALENAIKTCNRETDQLRRECRTKENELLDQLQSLSAKEASAKQTKLAVVEQINQQRQKINQLQKVVDDSNITAGHVQIAESALTEATALLSNSKAALDTAQNDNVSSEKAVLRRTLEEQIDNKSKEWSDMHRQSETRGVLEYKRKTRNETQQALDALLRAEDARYKRLLGQDVAVDTIEYDMSGLQAQKEADVHKAQEAVDKVRRELQRAEMLLSKEKADLESKDKDRRNLQLDVDAVCKGEDYEDYLTAKEADFDAAKKGLMETGGVETYLKGVLQFMNLQHSCMTCKRAVNHDEMKLFKFKIQNEINDIPNKRKGIETLVADLEPELVGARDLKVTVDRVKRLGETEIPAIRATMRNLRDEIHTFKTQDEDAQTALTKVKDELSEVVRLKKTAAEMSRHAMNIRGLDNEIASLQEQMAATGSMQSIQELELEITRLKAQYKAVGDEIENIRRQRDKLRDQVAFQERNVSKAELKAKDERNALQQIEATRQRIEELQADMTKLETQKGEAESQQRQVKPDIGAKEVQLGQMRRENEDKENHAQQHLNRLRQSKEQYESSTRAIQQYINTSGINSLARIEQSIREAEKSVEAASKRIDNMTSEIAGLEKEAADSVHVQRNLRDNLRYRKFKRDLATINKQLVEINVEENERAHQEYVERTNYLNTASQTKNAEAAGTRGELRGLEDSIREIEKKLSHQFKDIDRNVKWQRIVVRTTEAGVSDLEKYGNALDKAIMTYHGMKMEEVNDIIAYIWQKTYQGTDIDKIMIRSDNEEAKGNRSYNYRVVMVKGDVELDMRGRCSAGQKVLACIIIRLALGECFGLECGILALDEPTTNLDEENIRALACSLSDIIKERRSQANFQLIIITHDEQLLDHFAREGFAEYYYRVSRNSRMKSVIERQRVRN